MNYTSFLNNEKQFSVLKIFVNPDNIELRKLYEENIEKHNFNMINSEYPNSGFDLFIPDDVIFDKAFESKFIDLEIKCEMINNSSQTCAFFVYPRSSISKYPLMLANHTGIIDSGYRGNLIGAFRWFPIHNEANYIIEKKTRLLQICNSNLYPIMVKLVYNINELSESERGDGGFGSTGI